MSLLQNLEILGNIREGVMDKELIDKLSDFLQKLYANHAMHPMKTGRIAEKIFSFWKREGYEIVRKKDLSNFDKG